jgi:hypothetical protein
MNILMNKGIQYPEVSGCEATGNPMKNKYWYQTKNPKHLFAFRISIDALNKFI